MVKIFISSTSQDLEPYREAVRDIVLSLQHEPIMMEYFPSMDMNAVDGCLRKVDEAQAYIGVFAHRYGYCPPSSTISITEMEFDRASKNHIPRLCFLVDEQVSWPVQHIEGEPGQSKLRSFKARLETNVVRSTFSSPDNLALEVSKALYTLKLDTSNKRPKVSNSRSFIVRLKEQHILAWKQEILVRPNGIRITLNVDGKNVYEETIGFFTFHIHQNRRFPIEDKEGIVSFSHMFGVIRWGISVDGTPV